MLQVLGYICFVLLSIYVFVILSWTVYTSRYRHYRQTCPAFPWLGAIPYMYNMKESQMYKHLVKTIFSFNHFVLIWIGPQATFRVSCVEYLKPLLHSRKLLTKSTLYGLLHDWLGTGLLTSSGDKWKARRSALTPAFHFSILNDYFSIFETQSVKLVEFLKRSPRRIVDVQEICSLITLDIICEATMGVEINALESSESPYLKAIIEIKRLFSARMKKPYLYPKCLYQLSSEGKEFYRNVCILHNFTIDVINKRIESRKLIAGSAKLVHDSKKSSLKLKRAFLDTLLDIYERDEIDIDGIREEVDTFMFEGHDTTASALSWTLYEIGIHPDIQERLYAEVVLASNMTCPTQDKMKNVKYLENVIKEGLRLHPPIGQFGRSVTKDIVLNDTLFPSGSDIFVNTHATHLNPEYWDDPEVFNPDRFECDGFLKRCPYSYIPFSAGPRNCIGQKFALLELKTMLYNIVLNFEVRSLQRPHEIEEHCLRLITESSNGIHIEFMTRQ